MNKKSVELAMNTIIIAVIVLIVALIVIFMFQYYYKKETDVIGTQIDQLDDYDGDGTANMFDKCPCDITCICETDPKGKECEDYKRGCKTTLEKHYKTKK